MSGITAEVEICNTFNQLGSNKQSDMEEMKKRIPADLVKRVLQRRVFVAFICDHGSPPILAL